MLAFEDDGDTRLKLDPDEQVVIFTSGARAAHHRPNRLGPNAYNLQPNSPCPNIVEQAVSALKAAIKAWIFLVQKCNSACITETKQEIEGSLWEFTVPHPVGPPGIGT